MKHNKKNQIRKYDFFFIFYLKGVVVSYIFCTFDSSQTKYYCKELGNIYFKMV